MPRGAAPHDPSPALTSARSPGGPGASARRSPLPTAASQPDRARRTAACGRAVRNKTAAPGKRSSPSSTSTASRAERRSFSNRPTKTAPTGSSMPAATWAATRSSSPRRRGCQAPDDDLRVTPGGLEADGEGVSGVGDAGLVDRLHRLDRVALGLHHPGQLVPEVEVAIGHGVAAHRRTAPRITRRPGAVSPANRDGRRRPAGPRRG